MRGLTVVEQQNHSIRNSLDNLDFLTKQIRYPEIERYLETPRLKNDKT